MDVIRAFNETHKAAAIKALNEWSKVANINFIEVQEDNGVVGTLRFGFTDFTTKTDTGDPAAAWAIPPSKHASSGDIWLSTETFDDDYAQGTGYGFATLLHEIGHALGLKHPFEGAHKLDTILDKTNYTLMSYTDETGAYSNDDYIVSTGPMVLDVQAIQYLYGVKDFNLDDTVYEFDAASPFAMTIWDSGGEDLLDFKEFSSDLSIRLDEGSYSTIPVSAWEMQDNFGIAYGSVIENVFGGSGSDTITGNSADNEINGGLGVDTLSGGLGADIFTFKLSELSDLTSDRILDFESGTDKIKIVIDQNINAVPGALAGQVSVIDTTGGTQTSVGLPTETDMTSPLPPIVSQSGTSLLISGESGATLTLFDGVTEVTSEFLISEDAGTYTASLNTGAYDNQVTMALTAKLTDAAGNESLASEAMSAVFADITPPQTPIVRQIMNTIEITGETGAALSLLDGPTDVTSKFTVTESSGTYSASLNVGAYSDEVTLSLTAKLSDDAGNTSAASALASMTFTDITPPAAPSVSQSGSTLTISGESGNILTLFDGANDVTANFDIAETAGVYTATPKTDAYRSEVTMDLTARLTDAAGNISLASTGMATTFEDISSPLAPTISQAGATLIIVGEAGASLTLFDGARDVTTDFIINESSGEYTASLKTGAYLDEVAMSITAILTDIAGNIGATSSTLEAQFADITAPKFPTISQDGYSIIILGEAGATLTLFDGSVEVTSQFTVTEEDGTYTAVFASKELEDDVTMALTAKLTDDVGNTGAASSLMIANFQAPIAPTIATQTLEDVVTLTGTMADETNYVLELGDLNLQLAVLENLGSFDIENDIIIEIVTI